MKDALEPIPLAALVWSLLPVVLVWFVLQRWSMGLRASLVAVLRMVVQLVLVGYVLTAVFEARTPWVVLAVLVVMVAAASWIALGPLGAGRARQLPVALLAIGASGGLTLFVVTQLVLSVEPWYSPSETVPLAGMIFANAMNAVSLAADRFGADEGSGQPLDARRAKALQTALLPSTNMLLAVGLVSLPGMMTGQILAGVDPLIAVRYQIMVMTMVYGSGGLAAAGYLTLRRVA